MDTEPLLSRGLGPCGSGQSMPGHGGTLRELGTAREPGPNISTGAGTAWEGHSPGGPQSLPAPKPLLRPRGSSRNLWVTEEPQAGIASGSFGAAAKRRRLSPGAPGQSSVLGAKGRAPAGQLRAGRVSGVPVLGAGTAPALGRGMRGTLPRWGLGYSAQTLHCQPGATWPSPGTGGAGGWDSGKGRDRS